MLSRFLRILTGVAAVCLITAASLGSQQASDTLTLDAGQHLYEQDRFTEAEEVFQSVIQQEPKSALAHYWLGMALYEQQKDKEALKALKQAVKLDKTLLDGHISMGRVYLRMDKNKDARKALEKAKKLNPARAQIHYYIGLSHDEKIRLARIRRGKIKKVFKNQQDAFQRAIELDPQHPDAYYRLAVAYEELLEDYAGAIPLFFKQASVNPDHRDALNHLCRVCIQTAQYQKGVDLCTQLIELHGSGADPLLQGITAQLKAYYYQTQKQEDRALDAYETYLATLETVDPDEYAYYRDMSLIAPKDVVRQYLQASDPDKAEIWRQFWAARDPDPTTAVNERLTEHYRRVMYARQFFSHGQTPWDQRGEIYIRYGKPDDRQHFVFQSSEDATKNIMPTGNAKIDAIRETNRYQYNLQAGYGRAPWAEDEATALGMSVEGTTAAAFATESWVYVPYGLELFFIDQMGNGKYNYPLLPTQLSGGNLTDEIVRTQGFRFMSNPQQIVKTLIEKQPESYRYDYGGDTFTFVFDMVTFRGSEGQAQVEVAYSVPSNQLGDASDGYGMQTWFNTRVALQDEALRHITESTVTTGPIDRPLTAPSKRQVELRTSAFQFQAPPGTYRSSLALRDSITQRIGIYVKPLTVRDYNATGLQISDIKLSTAITPQSAPGPFTRNGLQITPHPAHIYPQSHPVYLYYEVYNLTQAADGRTSFQTTVEITAKDEQRGFAGRVLSGIGRLVTRSSDDKSVLLTFEDAGAGPDEYKYTSIDSKDLPVGTYTLILTITDLNSGQTTSSMINFIIVNS